MLRKKNTNIPNSQTSWWYISSIYHQAKTCPWIICLYKAVHARGHLQHACAALTFLAKLHQSSVSLCLIVHYGSPHRDKQRVLHTSELKSHLLRGSFHRERVGIHNLFLPLHWVDCGDHYKTWRRKYSHAVWHSTASLKHSVALIPLSFKGRQTRKTKKLLGIFPLRQRCVFKGARIHFP